MGACDRPVAWAVELQQLVAWKQCACSDSPSTMPQPLERRAQLLLGTQDGSDGADIGTFGSWEIDPEESVVVAPATSPQTQPQLQFLAAPGSDQQHNAEACTIQNCHFCLYDLRLRRRSSAQSSSSTDSGAQ